MSWLMLAALGMIWAAFLLPMRKGSSERSVEDFGRNMDLLAETGGHEGRWIITPRKGMAFIGPRARAERRARERRRRVFVFLLESIGLTFLIGLVPPLRVMWYVSAGLFALLVAYVWLLISIKERSPRARAVERARQARAPERARPVTPRYAAESGSRTARPVFHGLGAAAVDDLAHIVVKPADHVGVARA